jgi:hypothetical protein
MAMHAIDHGQSKRIDFDLNDYGTGGIRLPGNATGAGILILSVSTHRPYTKAQRH